MTDARRITIGLFLTQDQAKRAIALFAEHGPGGKFVDAVEKELIAPNMAAINAKIGQENHARFLAYAIEYAMIQASEYQTKTPPGSHAGGANGGSQC